jgi:Fe-S-cluster-containing hydrogenase component 2
MLSELKDFAALAKDDAEVELGFADKQRLGNARRCYLCHYKFEIDSDNCIRCGKCLLVCPTGAISMRLAKRVCTAVTRAKTGQRQWVKLKEAATLSRSSCSFSISR